MKIHEYQAKELLARYGIPVGKGIVAESPEGAREAAERLEPPYVVKAQIQVGGRGKAGGIKPADTPEDVSKVAAELLGATIKGLRVRRILVTHRETYDREYYLGVILDRDRGLPLAMASAEGGIDIEEVAVTRPEAIHKMHFDPTRGLRDFEARWLACEIESDSKTAVEIGRILARVSRAFLELDASLAEINPLVRLRGGGLVALDAKINLDDSGLAFHEGLEDLRDRSEEDPNQEKARAAGLSYIPLTGTIGCVVNGAGLAMATMDLVKHFGGDPANFLDIGGSSNPAKVVTALEIITSVPRVRGILFNIFGGITRCDDVAKGILEALNRVRIEVPIVVRLTGTNEEVARSMLEAAEGVEAAQTMEEAVSRVIDLAG